MLKKLTALGIGIGLSLTGSVSAQDHNHPALNSFGRYFGIGWSHGYQAGWLDGRFQSSKNRHPANMYRSSALLYPYHPSYMPANIVIAQPAYSGVYSQPAGAATLADIDANQVTPTLAPEAPPKPVEPPPTWLRPFLKDGDKSDPQGSPVDLLPSESPNQLQPAEASPSDLRNLKSEADDDLLGPSARLTPMQRYNEARQRHAAKR